MTDNRSRSIRAVLRTAVTWGAAWAVAGGAIVTALGLFQSAPGLGLLGRLGLAALSGVAWGVRFGIVGAAMGVAFASAIRFGYRGRRLADISPWRFGALGAVVGGVGVPLYLQAMNVLTGGSTIAWHLVTDDAVWGTVFGAAAAAGSILLARRAAASAGESHPDELEGGAELDALPAGETRQSSFSQRSRSTQR